MARRVREKREKINGKLSLKGGGEAEKLSLSNMSESLWEGRKEEAG